MSRFMSKATLSFVFALLPAFVVLVTYVKAGEITLSDNFEDGSITSKLWTYGSRRFSWTPTDPGSWTASNTQTVTDAGDPKGYLQLLVDGPDSGNSYGDDAWLQSVQNFNDGLPYMANFTWKILVSGNNQHRGYIQVTDGYIPTFAQQNWQTGWLDQEPAGTESLLWTTNTVPPNSPFGTFTADSDKQTWSILLDPSNDTAQLYDGPDGSGSLLHTASLDPIRPWYLRFMVEGATSAGFTTGASSLDLYSVTVSAVPEPGTLALLGCPALIGLLGAVRYIRRREAQ